MSTNKPMNGHAHPYERPMVVPPMQHPRMVEFSGEVQRLSLAHGDLLVLKIDAQLDMDTVDRLKAYLAAACNIEPRRVIVLGLGMNLAVLAKGGDEK